MNKFLSYLKKTPLLFLLIFIVYNCNMREISAGDTIPAKYLPISVLTEFDLDLDEFPFLYNMRGNNDYLFIQKTEEGHWYSSYPVTVSLISTPIYAPAILSGMKITAKNVDILAKTSASAIAALSAIFLFLILKLLTDEDNALLWTLIYAFATSTWSVSSQGLWQHGTVQLFLLAGIYFLLKNEKSGKSFAAPSLCLAICVSARMPTALIALAVFFYILFNRREKLIKFIIPASVAAVLLFSYNFYHFGSFAGGNALLEKKMLVTKGITSIWTGNFLPGLAGLLFGPSRGILTYSPILIFSFISLLFIFRDRGKTLFKFLAASTLFYILLFSFYRAWWAGHTFGYRYLLDIVPLLCIFPALYTERFLSSKPVKIIFILFISFSVLVQVTGFLSYPGGWNRTPQNIDKAPERNWDIVDNQIARCVKSGIRYPRFLSKKY